MPLNIGRAKSGAAGRGMPGDKLIGVLTQKNSTRKIRM
jgi:hypothetical protein